MLILRKMILLFLLLTALLVLPDLYVWLGYLRGSAPPAWSALYWLPTLASLTLLGCWAAGCGSETTMRLFFILLLAAAFPKLLFAACSLAGRGLAIFAPRAAAVCNGAGVVAALALCLTLLYGLTGGWHRLTVRETEIAFANLPDAFDGYRIAHLSDLHAGSYGLKSRFIERLVEEVGARHPDIVLFTGDLVNTAPEELDPHMQALARLRAPDGTYSVLGNHDYCEYRRYDTDGGAARSLEALKERQARMGWQLLLNEHRTIRRGAESIELIGVENDSRPPFPSRGDLRNAMRGVAAERFKILLSHDPTHWRREVLPATDIDLTLSGHTHAMQLRIGRFSPASWLYAEWGGLYREGAQTLYVSTGIGGTAPFRLGAWPAIEIITLRKGR